MSVEVSLIVPVFNEVDNVQPLYEQLASVMDSLGKSVELVIVDDGSTDGTTPKAP